MPLTQPADVVQPPAPPAPPAPGTPVVAPVTVGADGGARFVVSAPTTAEQLRGLRGRLSELRRQLSTARDDRLAIAQRLRQGTAGGADQAGLEARIRVIDDRIVRIEQDVSATQAAITSARPELFAAAEAPPRREGGMSGDAKAALGGVFMIFVMMPIVVSWARLVWRRGARGSAPTNRESDARLARLETAVDTIAIEMERVSEGQRFVTRLLSESRAPAPTLDMPSAEPVRAVRSSAG